VDQGSRSLTAAGSGLEADRVQLAPPRPVLLARWLWIAAALLSSARSLIGLADRDALRDQVQQMYPEQGIQQVEDTVNAEITVGLMIGALVLLLYVKLANRMCHGGRLARIVLTVFGVGGVLLGSLGFLAVATGLTAGISLRVEPIDVALSLSGIALQAVAVVSMFLPVSAGYFRAARRVPRAAGVTLRR